MLNDCVPLPRSPSGKKAVGAICQSGRRLACLFATVTIASGCSSTSAVDAGLWSDVGPGSPRDAQATPRAVEASDDAGGVVAETGADAAGDAGPAEAGENDASGDAVSPEGGGSSCASTLGGGPTVASATHLDVAVHDPSMIWDGSRYYLFGTGGSLNVRSSPDMRTWTGAGGIFAATPPWVTAALGADPKSLWAPDVSYFNGEFHIYYAGSTFGSKNSVIGLVTNPVLDARNPRYAWVDRGLVVQSKPADVFNAIDPNVAFDASCAPWLAFGSFSSGVKLHKLAASTGKLATDDPVTYSLASRNGGAIEAASIVSHNGYHYLFVSFDSCCQGINSTYKTMVGRSLSISGPYTNKAGIDMMQGGAELLLATVGRYIGPGGGTAWKDGATYLYAYHYYDGQANGASKLLVRPIVFTADDWITLGDPLFP
ncbi:MAG: arabinan endo-1,5-alpha-L-arabinosidase [Myxococcota bacterium]|nr:arabinan endo-1,5-alpha-L-arabinosidase [Myxococcota bacterium]